MEYKRVSFFLRTSKETLFRINCQSANDFFCPETKWKIELIRKLKKQAILQIQREEPITDKIVNSPEEPFPGKLNVVQ